MLKFLGRLLGYRRAELTPFQATIAANTLKRTRASSCTKSKAIPLPLASRTQEQLLALLEPFPGGLGDHLDERTLIIGPRHCVATRGGIVRLKF